MNSNNAVDHDRTSSYKFSAAKFDFSNSKLSMADRFRFWPIAN